MRSKNLLSLFCAALLLLSAAGCTICSTCTYSYYYYGVESTYEEQYCGSRYEVRNFEDDFIDGAQQQNVSADCNRH
ncbi:MAG: hypothetical protein H6546_00630 [Chitinophagales bacterium]|nr:hypothetical protein [Chitinophagales bacterium]